MHKAAGTYNINLVSPYRIMLQVHGTVQSIGLVDMITISVMKSKVQSCMPF